MSMMPERGGMLTILSSCNGPGASSRPLADHERAPDDDEQKHQHGENGIADNHQRIARTPRRAAWHRHLIGLERGAGAARSNAFRLHD